MKKKKLIQSLRALVVDDSAYLRRLIANTLNAIPDVEVVGTAFNGQEAISLALRLKPDLITLDLEMPEMDGFTFLRWLMHDLPTPTIIVSSEGSEENVLKALDLGAVDFIVKPTRKIGPALNVIQDILIEKVGILRNLRIEKIRQRLSSQKTRTVPPEPVHPHSPSQCPVDLVAIGASTGGPPALQSILNRFPRDFPAAVAVVQHMPPNFTAFFAERLDKTCSLSVKEAEDGDVVCPGRALIAPGGKNMIFRENSGGAHVVLEPKRNQDKFTPSVNATMESSARLFGERTLGVLLTGMGDDGKLGMKAIKEHEGMTIAESEESAIIFGMPAEAIRAGVVDHVLHLDLIPRKILSICLENQ